MDLFVSYKSDVGNGWVVFSDQTMPQNVQDVYKLVNKIKEAENLSVCIPISFQQLGAKPITEDMPEVLFVQCANKGFTRWLADTYKPEGDYREYRIEDPATIQVKAEDWEKMQAALKLSNECILDLATGSGGWDWEGVRDDNDEALTLAAAYKEKDNG